ncbi:GAF domain-containing protein [Nakamurella sp. UYEF19]|uniref:GAF and ANTAR domain-containing protein n=1 Tax=Nakamurella sp. UYEF19 TaxID=1756392 RepID=UPI00339693EC
MTASGELDVVKAFAQVAVAMDAAESIAGARLLVAALARDALGSAGTAIWHLKADSTMELDSSTDPDFMVLMADIVGRKPDGPAWQTMQDRRVTLADDFSTETRWPGYVSRLVAESPVRSAVVYPLGLAQRDLGVLAVYSHQPRHFDAGLVALGAVFAAYASLALENADLAEKARNLAAALGSNRRIGMAIGILMGRNNLTESQAFDLLRVTSQNTNTKLSAVAEGVVLTGTIRTLGPA